MIIATVRLAPGRVGYFDELTRTHLTIKAPEKDIHDTMDTTGLKRAVKSGAILLVSGSLDLPEAASQPYVEVPIVKPVEAKQTKTVEEKDIESQVVAKETKIVEEKDIEPQVVAEETKAEVAPETVETTVEVDEKIEKKENSKATDKIEAPKTNKSKGGKKKKVD